jgi:hypothetical protein
MEPSSEKAYNIIRISSPVLFAKAEIKSAKIKILVRICNFARLADS